MQPAHATTTAHTPTAGSEPPSKTPSRKPSATPENLNWAASHMTQSLSSRPDPTTDQLALVAEKLTRLSLGLTPKRRDEATDSNIHNKKLK